MINKLTNEEFKSYCSKLLTLANDLAIDYDSTCKLIEYDDNSFVFCINKCDSQTAELHKEYKHKNRISRQESLKLFHPAI